MATNLIVHERVTWTDILAPTRDDMAALHQRYPQFHPLNLQDCLTVQEHPKLDTHDDYIFLVVHLPVWDEQERLSRVAEVDLFVARGTLVTSHQADLPALRGLWAEAAPPGQARDHRLGRGASPLLYDVLTGLIGGYEPLLAQVDGSLRHLEQNLFRDNTRHLLTELALTRRNLIALRRMLKPQVEVMQSLARGSWSFIHEDLDLYWGDLSDTLAEMRATLDEQYEVISGLSDTVDTLASHRIDDVVRLLTYATMVTLPLTVISTVFSMNVLIPGERHPLTFPLAVGTALVLTVGVIWYLRHRRR
jgi:magnesium transporter